MPRPWSVSYTHLDVYKRQVYHLGLQGVRFDESSRKTDAKGNTKAIYLQDEVGGFAIHLVKR